MQNQLTLFEVELQTTEVAAVYSQLPRTQRENALRLLAELMARSVTGCDGANHDSGSEEDSHE